MEDWAEIRRLYRSEKLSQAAIARRMRLSRNTVANALASEAPPRYERAPMTTSAWAQVELAVRVLLGQYPTMPASVIAQRVVGRWTKAVGVGAAVGNELLVDSLNYTMRRLVGQGHHLIRGVAHGRRNGFRLTPLLGDPFRSGP